MTIFATDVVITAPVSGGPYFSRMWWTVGVSTPTSGEVSEALSRFSDYWNLLDSVIASGCNIIFDPASIVINEANGALVGVVAGTAPTTISTLGGSNPLPPRTQGLIGWITSDIVAGRRVQGRSFVPLPDESQNLTAGVPGSSYTSQLDSAIAALLTPGSPFVEPVIWHRPQGGAGGSDHVITAGVARTQWSSLRTRGTA